MRVLPKQAFFTPWFGLQSFSPMIMFFRLKNRNIEYVYLTIMSHSMRTKPVYSEIFSQMNLVLRFGYQSGIVLSTENNPKYIRRKMRFHDII